MDSIEIQKVFSSMSAKTGIAFQVSIAEEHADDGGDGEGVENP